VIRATIGFLLLGVYFLLTCLLFWPVTLLLALGVATGPAAEFATSLRGEPTRLAEALVGRIANHKASMLAFSISLAAALGVAALVIAVLDHEGHQLTSFLTGAAGYLAVIGLVLGLPALGYAMVTDRAVDDLAIRLRLTMLEVAEGEQEIQARLSASLTTLGAHLPPGHFPQVFLPNPDRTLLLPFYDPENEGPKEGWEVGDSEAPQAITGSAWVKQQYMWATQEGLSDPRLRLTPEQTYRFQRLTGVAAAPVWGNEGEPIAVLTIYTAVDSPSVNDPAFIRLHLRLAHELAPVIESYVAPPGALQFTEVAIGDSSSYPSGALET
jgi:hypothetical protein